MSETYTIGGDTLVKCDNPDWQGQTFRPLQDHTLEYIDLNMRGPLIIPEPVIQIFMADSNHEPFGSPLSRNRYTLEKHCSLLTTGRVRFSMQSTQLLAGDYYAIIVSNFPPPGGSSAFWQYDKDNATYPRGLRISSNDSGATWTKHYNDDFIFAEFGLPPLPKPDPPPPIENFAIPDYAFTPWDVGIFITLPTTVPCHLTCYWTDKQPLKHHTSRIVRGLEVPWATYFCFVAWKAVQQSEPGDSLYHTFAFTEWPFCQEITLEFLSQLQKSIALFYEPWGTHLLDYNTWFILADPEPPVITFEDGIITLNFTNTHHSGINYLATNGALPLEDADARPCTIFSNVTEVISEGHWDAIVHGFYCKSATEDMLLYLTHTMHEFTLFPDKKGYLIERGIHVGYEYIGTGLNKFNLLKLFQETRTHFGLSTDPAGWYISQLEIASRQAIAGPPSILKSDMLSIYYPPPPLEGQRWFTFRGEVDTIKSPSVGPIFSHCLLDIQPQDLILRPYAPGDKCSIYITGNGPPCPNHWQTVNDVIPDEETSELISETINKWWGWDLYHIPNLPNKSQPLEYVRLTGRLKKVGGLWTTSCVALHLKTHGAEYTRIMPSGVPSIYTYFDWLFNVNPFTNKPWTVQEVNDLQIGVGLRKTWGIGWEARGHCTQLFATVRQALPYHL